MEGGVGGTVMILIWGWTGLTMVKDRVIGVRGATTGLEGLEGRDERREGNMVVGMQR